MTDELWIGIGIDIDSKLIALVSAAKTKDDAASRAKERSTGQTNEPFKEWRAFRLDEHFARQVDLWLATYNVEQSERTEIIGHTLQRILEAMDDKA